MLGGLSSGTMDGVGSDGSVQRGQPNSRSGRDTFNGNQEHAFQDTPPSIYGHSHQSLPYGSQPALHQQPYYMAAMAQQHTASMAQQHMTSMAQQQATSMMPMHPGLYSHAEGSYYPVHSAGPYGHDMPMTSDGELQQYYTYAPQNQMHPWTPQQHYHYHPSPGFPVHHHHPVPPNYSYQTTASPSVSRDSSWNWVSPEHGHHSGRPSHSGLPSSVADQAMPSVSPPLLKGPPIKPKQSGHALWVGNIPQYTSIIDLKDHFSRNATQTIESIKLMSRTRCAFVNYSTHEACVAAQLRFHDVRFHETVLVCRMRKVIASGQDDSAGSPTGTGSNLASPGGARDGRTTDGASPGQPAKRRYFIMKSLSVNELQAAERDLKWATQEHNVEALNQAFETSETVYLIFSANKSGEYYGLARMASKIEPSIIDGMATMSFGSPVSANTSSAATSEASLRKAYASGTKFTMTCTTEYAPRGRLIDDNSRSIVFWEATSASEGSAATVTPTGLAAVVDVNGTDEDANDTASSLGTTDAASAGSSRTPLDDETEITDPVIVTSPPYDALSSASSASHNQNQPAYFPQASTGSDTVNGTEFAIEWLSSRKVPFSRLRGLRNAWNAGREVKIARDGTEIETMVGEKVVNCFYVP